MRRSSLGARLRAQFFIVLISCLSFIVLAVPLRQPRVALKSHRIALGSRPAFAAQAAQQSGPADPEVSVPRQIDFPYYSLRQGFNSTLNLVRASGDPAQVSISIHASEGQTLSGPALLMQPYQKASFDLRTLITQLGGDPDTSFSEGSLTVQYVGPSMAVVGRITAANPEMGLSTESEMVETTPGAGMAPAVLNGAWWGLRPGRLAQVLLTNTSEDSVTADVYLDFAGARNAADALDLGPRETRTLNIPAMLSQLKVGISGAPEGGITIVPRGSGSSLIAQGAMTEPATGFSTTLHFPIPEMEVATALHASGVPIGIPGEGSPYAGLGTFTPHVVVRNLLSTPQTITLTIEYPGDDGPHQADLGSVPLQGYTTKDITLDAFSGSLPVPLPYCSIRIQHSGPPGSVIAEVASVESGGDLVVDSKVSNEGDMWAGSGAYPWHLDDGTESTLFLTNMGDQECGIGLRFDAEGGSDGVPDITLKPHETRSLDIRRLRDTSKYVPHSATDGSVLWGRIESVPVMGRLVVLKRGQGMASAFSCQDCSCPLSFTGKLYVTDTCDANTPNKTYPQTFAVVPGGTKKLVACAQMSCSSTGGKSYHDVSTSSTTTWSSDNTSAATVDNSSNKGLVTGVAVGQANIKATYTGKSFIGCLGLPKNVTASATGVVKVASLTVNLGPPPSSRSNLLTLGDSLSFANVYPSCVADRIGAYGCNAGVFWQAEIKIAVSDAGTNWVVTQDKHGATFTVNGVPGTTMPGPDGPPAVALQQSTSTQIFYIDAPGMTYGTSTQTVTFNETFTSRACRKDNPQSCSCRDWTVILSGDRDVNGVPRVITSQSSASAASEYSCGP